MSCVLWPPYTHHKSKEFNAKIQDYNYSWGLLWYFTPDCLALKVSVRKTYIDCHELRESKRRPRCRCLIEGMRFMDLCDPCESFIYNLLHYADLRCMTEAPNAVVDDERQEVVLTQVPAQPEGQQAIPSFLLELKWPDVPWVDSIS